MNCQGTITNEAWVAVINIYLHAHETTCKTVQLSYSRIMHEHNFAGNRLCPLKILKTESTKYIKNSAFSKLTNYFKK